MQEKRGKRDDTVRYVHEGYEYHIDTDSIHIYRCSTRSSSGCRGAARVDGRRVEVYHRHEGHPPNETIAEEAVMRFEMLDLAAETNTPLKEIFDTVCRRNPVVAPKFLFPSMRVAMQRARAKVRPLIPDNLRELARVLDTYAPTERYYRGLVEADDGSVALVFVSDEMLAAVNAANEIYVDGTFKVAPYHPPIAQLYTVHLGIMDTGIASIYILCGARTRAMYTVILRKVVDLAPGLRENLRLIMGDYERAAMTAFREVFPEANLHGCWFHFNQALLRRWRRLGLTGVNTNILALAMALPLAPADKFAEGLGLLAGLADQIAPDHPAALQFMHYLRRQWSPLADVLSVHGCPAKTNNLVESFHNEAKRKLGGLHPNIWKFIEHLTQLIANQALDLIRLENGNRPRRARTIRNMARETLIRDAQHNLSLGRYTLMEFLRRCATRTAAFRFQVDDDAAEGEGAAEDEALVNPGLMAIGAHGDNEPVLRGGRRGRGGLRPRNRAVPERPAQRNEVNPPQIVRQENAEIGGRGDAIDDEERIPPVEDDVFHLPEDEWEQIPVPEDAVPYHPVADVQRVEDERPAGPSCCACLIAPATHAFIPCGHQCCCETCAERIGRRCPVCRDEGMGAYRIRADV